jgi:Rrf2 family protein
MFSQTVEYALRAIVCLATTPDQPQTARQIAEATRVPVPYLSKVLQGLSREGLIRSQRGLHGGFMLTKSPEILTIYEVIEAVEPLPRLKECPLGLASHGISLCPLHRRLDDAMAQVEKTFRSTTLAELLREPADSKPLCSIPMPPAT